MVSFILITLGDTNINQDIDVVSIGSRICQLDSCFDLQPNQGYNNCIYRMI